jgi:hypothetical protein
MWRQVSEERIASIIRVEIIGDLVQTLALTNNWTTLHTALNKVLMCDCTAIKHRF